MLFSSPVYLFLFLPIVVVGYFFWGRLRHHIVADIWLVAASLYFYGYGNPHYILLFVFSLILNYIFGTYIQRAHENANTRNGRRLCAAGIVFNLLLLAYFKYTNFIVFNLNALLSFDIQFARQILPLAISFYTFQQIAWLVDSHRGTARPCGFITYSVFITFFPKLIAGPIVRYHEMIPRLRLQRRMRPNWNNIANGMILLCVGLAKKVVIANGLAHLADAGFSNAALLTFWDAWITSFSYTFQLYFDFSGYTDMAIGAALMFNIHLPINFDSPYKALSIQDFWQRWHITLSNWLRDYLYIPLGGSRAGQIRTSFNLLVTMLLAGLWHGAGWNFIIWGGIHGLGLLIHRIWRRMGLRMPSLMGWLLTINLINAALVFFRAVTFADAVHILQGMAGMNGLSVSTGFASSFNRLLSWLPYTLNGADIPHVGSVGLYLCVLLLSIVVLVLPNSNTYAAKKPYRFIGVVVFCAVMLLYVSVYRIGIVAPTFIYADF